MVVGVCDDDILLESQTEAVRRIELPLVGPQLAELAAYLHRTDFVGTGVSTVGIGGDGGSWKNIVQRIS